MPKNEKACGQSAPRALPVVAVLFASLVEIDDPMPHSAAVNMAVDEVLLGEVGGDALLRVYRWARPAVSFGYFGRHAEVAAAWPERELVRRWTGGGIVPHGEDITYSLLVPKAHPFAALGPLESYRVIHEALVAWMAALGVGASLTPGAVKLSDECFANPAPHDVMAGGQKVAGAAQRRTRHGLLHQGSIQGVRDAEGGRATLASAFAPAISRQSLSASQLAAAESLAETKYGSIEWMQRW